MVVKMNVVDPTVCFLKGDPGAPAGTVFPKEGADDDIFPDRHSGERFNDLKRPGNPKVADPRRPEPGNPFPLEGDLTLGDRVDACDQIHQGRLSGSVRTNQAEDFMALDMKVDLIDCPESPKGLGNGLALDENHAHLIPPDS
jgi:hypothetical protein